MRKILVFAGTIEGRILSEVLADKGFFLDVCVATDYGEELIIKKDNIVVHSGRLTEKEMVELIKETSPEKVVDATHPYATIVTENIKKACENAGYEYIRLLREAGEKTENADVLMFDDKYQVIEYLNKTEGNVLFTTGSKEIFEYIEGIKDISRIYPRILPDGDVINKLKETGILGKQIICMQGPFSKGLNVEMLKATDAKYLVTKDTGVQGGFSEKIKATKELGVTALVIKRPDESGLCYDEVLNLLLKEK